MSHEHRVYFGPYIHAQNPRIKKNVTFPACGDDDCPRSMRRVEKHVNFCPRCGHAVAQRATTTMDRSVNPYDALENHLNDFALFNDGGGDPDKDILIPNRSDLGEDRPCLVGASTGEQEFVVTPILMEKEIAWFRRTFADAIRAVWAAYGKEAVAIRWGVLAA